MAPLARLVAFVTLTPMLFGCSSEPEPASGSTGGSTSTGSSSPGGASLGGTSFGSATQPSSLGGTSFGSATQLSSAGGTSRGGASPGTTQGGASLGGASFGSATQTSSLGGASRGDTSPGGTTAGGGGQGGTALGGATTGGSSTGVGAAGFPASMTTIQYTTDTSTIFANPERGFYHHEETHSNNHVALNSSQLARYRTDEAISLILRLYYLESFRSSDISATYLDAISADLNAIRLAGVKAILRFAYTDSMTAPYGDADRARVLRHIAQLAPILQQHADIVLTVQAGFIGAWGEWYYTDHFGDEGQISNAQWDDRKAVVDAWLAALPNTRTIQLRTPAFKRHFFGTSALTSAEAFTTTGKARVGHHNDCFLASADDQGTYVDITADKAYLAAENLFVPQGGETCDSSGYSDWTHAASDMASLHYTYLNRDYNTLVLDSWGNNLDVARRLLGYRLSLTSGTYANTATPNGTFTISMSLRNDGYAPPIGPRAFDLLLRNETTGALYRAQLPIDPRRFVPGSAAVVNVTLCTPVSLAAGSYRLLLALSDPAPTLRTQPAYAIRLANPQLWDANTGVHDLQHRLSVSGTTGLGCPAEGVALVAE